MPRFHHISTQVGTLQKQQCSYLLDVGLELGRLGILEGHSQGPNLVVVGTTLEGGEDGKVNLVLKVILGALWLPLLQPISWLSPLQMPVGFESEPAPCIVC